MQQSVEIYSALSIAALVRAVCQSQRSEEGKSEQYKDLIMILVCSF